VDWKGTGRNGRGLIWDATPAYSWRQVWFGGFNISVGIATRFGPMGPKLEPRWDSIPCTSPHLPRAPPSLLYKGTGSPGVKEAGAWRCPPTPFSRRGPEWLELCFCLRSPLRVCLASNGSSLPLPLTARILLLIMQVEQWRITYNTRLTHDMKCYQPYWLPTPRDGCFLLDHTCDDLTH